jgi:hypothetical protein
LHEDKFTGRGFPNGKEIDEGIYKTVTGRFFIAPGLDALKGSTCGPPSEAGGSTVSGSSFAVQ